MKSCCLTVILFANKHVCGGVAQFGLSPGLFFCCDQVENQSQASWPTDGQDQHKAKPLHTTQMARNNSPN